MPSEDSTANQDPTGNQAPQGPQPPQSYKFFITREPWTDFFKVYLVDLKTGLPNGQSEELDVDETYAWFLERGAELPLLEKALDHVWNFFKGAVEIENYKEPTVINPAIEPRLD